jgi:DNA-binding transcriptional regulator YbjK
MGEERAAAVMGAVKAAAREVGVRVGVMEAAATAAVAREGLKAVMEVMVAAENGQDLQAGTCYHSDPRRRTPSSRSPRE